MPIINLNMVFEDSQRIYKKYNFTEIIELIRCLVNKLECINRENLTENAQMRYGLQELKEAGKK